MYEYFAICDRFLAQNHCKLHSNHSQNFPESMSMSHDYIYRSYDFQKSYDFQVTCSVCSQNPETRILGRIALFLWPKNRHFGFKGLIVLFVCFIFCSSLDHLWVTSSSSSSTQRCRRGVETWCQKTRSELLFTKH